MAADGPHLLPKVDAIVQHTLRRPAQLLAHARYFSEPKTAAVQAQTIEGFRAPDKIKHTHTLSAAPRG